VRHSPHPPRATVHCLSSRDGLPHMPIVITSTSGCYCPLGPSKPLGPLEQTSGPIPAQQLQWLGGLGVRNGRRGPRALRGRRVPPLSLLIDDRISKISQTNGFATANKASQWRPPRVPVAVWAAQLPGPPRYGARYRRSTARLSECNPPLRAAVQWRRARLVLDLRVQVSARA
jgi:hypothetical protein